MMTPAQPPATSRQVAAVAVAGLCHSYPPRKVRRRERAARSAADQPVAPTSALADVYFEVAPGEIFGILGPNGGGKSTLFRILATMLQPQPTPSAGAVRVFGHDVTREPDRVREQIGVVFQNPSLDVKLTAEENLIHHGRLYGLGRRVLRERIDRWLEQFGLADRRHDFVETFSGGMRRRLEIAKALLHEPRLLLLDEPTTGLDPGARRDLWQRLPELRERLGVTIALTTHLMEEAEHCGRLAFLAGGRLLAVDTPANLKARVGGDVVTVTLRYDAQTTPEALAAAIAGRFGPWPGDGAKGTSKDSGRPRVVDGRVRCESDDGALLLGRIREAYGPEIHSVTLGQPSLEDVFLHLAGQSFWAGDAEAPPTASRH